MGQWSLNIISIDCVGVYTMAGSDECLLGKTKRIKEEEEEEGDIVSNDDTLEHVHKKRGVPEVGQPDSILLIESRQAEQLLQLDYSSSHQWCSWVFIDGRAYLTKSASIL